MREIITSGSVGRAPGNRRLYPEIQVIPLCWSAKFLQDLFSSPMSTPDSRNFLRYSIHSVTIPRISSPTGKNRY